ncbi:MAG: hypothetical protein IPN01_29795 [Deltaproteobacteria bacterium]|nr:hypothetical protein [Deltaproteobacteria bacterium]
MLVRASLYPKNHQVTAHLFNVLRRHPEGKLILNNSPSVAAFIEKPEWAQPSIAKELASQQSSLSTRGRIIPKVWCVIPKPTYP